MRGYGSAANQGSSPAYAEVAANPSATFSVALGDEVIGQVRWADLDAGRAIEPNPRLRVEVVDPGRNWVRTTVVDDATGRPIPCRVHFRSPEGVPYAPHGHHAHLNSELHTWHIDVGGDVRLGGVTYAYIDGRCEGWLPRGEVLVDVAHGFEYEPLRAAIQIAPGQQELTLRLKRWCDMNARHNYSGDTHVHFLSTQGAQLEMLRLPGNGGTVEVEADAESILPIPRLEIVQQGHVVAAIEERDGARHLRLHARLPIQGHTWLAERVAGPGYFGAIPHHDVWHRGIMAHTSPIYVAVGGEWDLYDPDVAAYMLTLLEGSLTYIRTRSRQYPPETVTHFHGQADHEAVLEGPFHEAVQALHARMHRLEIPH